MITSCGRDRGDEHGYTGSGFDAETVAISDERVSYVQVCPLPLVGGSTEFSAAQQNNLILRLCMVEATALFGVIDGDYLVGRTDQLMQAVLREVASVAMCLMMTLDCGFERASTSRAETPTRDKCNLPTSTGLVSPGDESALCFRSRREKGLIPLSDFSSLNSYTSPDNSG